MILLLIALIGGLLAYANGANDNFKGVATLLGSGTLSYRKAMQWGTLTTILGSLTALFLARGLLAAFSGKGLVPFEVIADPVFAGATALAAGTTVLAAARLGFPISTTHALIGGLVGAGLIASPTGISTDSLASGLLLPLLSSPLLAIALSSLIYPCLRFMRQRMGVTRETCVCIGEQVVGVVPGALGPAMAMQAMSLPVPTTGDLATCTVRYRGQFMGLSAARMLDIGHFISAGSVSFARGLNDTPKIAALLLVGGTLSANFAILAVALAMAAGGWLGSRRVAETLAHNVTEMNQGQGFSANLVTSLLVIGASGLGLPVSTTHVSCGSLFGIGMVTGGAHWKSIRQILWSWVITLPLAAGLGALFVSLAKLAS